MPTQTLPTTTSTELARRSVNLDPEQVPAIMTGMIGPVLETSMGAILDDAGQITAVADATDYELALDVCSRLNGCVKNIEAAVDPLVTILHKMHKASTTYRGAVTEFAAAESKRLNALATAWRVAEEKRQREEAARLQREQEAKERREREERDRQAQAEAERLQAIADAKEAEANRIAALDAAEAERLRNEAIADQVAAQEVINQRAEESEIEALTPTMQVIAAPVVAPGVKTAGSQRVTWKARVFNKAALIDAAAKNPFFAAFLIADESALNKLASSQHAEMRVPGVEVYAEASTSVRASR